MKVRAEYEHSDTLADNVINQLYINLNILFW
jgi:hypothetical protein